MAYTETKDHLTDPTLNFLANLPEIKSISPAPVADLGMIEQSTMLDIDLPWIEDAPKAVPELTPEGYPVITLTQTEDDIGSEELVAAR